MKNRLLARQLKVLGLSPDSVPHSIVEWRSFLTRIEKAYEENERNHYLLERSLEISSKEMQCRWDELKQFERQWRSLGECLPDVVIMVDATGRIIFSNRGMNGIQPESLIGQELYACYGADTANGIKIKQCVERAVSESIACSVEIEMLDKSGSRRFFSVRVNPIQRAEQPAQLVFVQTDITETRTIEAAIEARRRAEEADETKSRFLANMSHEIRTPLTAILGFSEILAGHDIPDTQRLNILDIIRRNGHLLLNIINDILDLSKVEAGKLDIELTNMALLRIVSDTKALLGLRAAEKGVKLTITSDSQIPSVIRTDPLRLRQILLNVIGNAIKFTEKGSVDVSIGLIPGANGTTKLAFTVKDTGIGIQKDQVERIFAPFSQADPSTTRKFGGTGLGLSLSKNLAKLLGGDVILQESTSHGSVFLVTIEPGTVEANSAHSWDLTPESFINTSPGINAPNFENLSILLVEDSLDNQIIVSYFLQDTGASVVTANNGREGLAKALAGKFDVVLMDLQMPEMDGYVAVKELRRQGYTRPIVALSAYSMDEDRRRCLDVGFNSHLSKPIDRDLLLQTISRFSRRLPMVHANA